MIDKILNNDITIKIEGNNILRFIGYLYKQNIVLKDIKYTDKNTCFIRINNNDYNSLKEIKSIYNNEIVNFHGFLKIKRYFKLNKIFIISLVFGYIILVILSNIIFSVEVLHSNNGIRKLVITELDNYNISKFHFKKSYSKLDDIKKKIIDEHREKIEWMEIEEVGTSYIIRVEERKKPFDEEPLYPRHIVATKSGIIKRLNVKTGQIVKNINEYVVEGGIIVSGSVMQNGVIMDFVSATGEVYAEVWYEVSVSIPFNYTEKINTENSDRVIVINFFGNKIDLFNFKKVDNYDYKSKKVLLNRLLPFSLSFEIREEYIYIDKIYTVAEGINEAMASGREKIEEGLGVNEQIINGKVLNYNIIDSKIYIDIFFSVYEEIGDYQKIVGE